MCLLLVAVRGMDAIERRGRSERTDRRWVVAAAALTFDLVAVGLIVADAGSTSGLLGTVLFGATAAGALADAAVLAGEAGGRETLRGWMNRLQSELPPGYSVAIAAFPAKVGLLVHLEPLPASGSDWAAEPSDGGEVEGDSESDAEAPPPQVLDDAPEQLRELVVERLDAAAAEQIFALREQVAFEAIFDEEAEVPAGGELAALRVIEERLPRAVPRMVVVFRDLPAPAHEGLMASIEAALPSLSGSDSYAELVALVTGHLAATIRPKPAEPEPPRAGRNQTGAPEAASVVRHEQFRRDAAADPERSDLWSAEERVELQQAGRSDLPWLILGEPGTAKGLAARAMHLASPRRTQPFLEVDVSEFDDATLASTLFGDAGSGREGLMKSAHGGTVALRSVSHLQPRLLEALLRRLEKLPIRVVLCEHAPWSGDHGGTVVPAAMLRFVGDRVLERAPLRARPREVERLAHRTLQRASAQFARPVVRLSADALRFIKAQPLRGNHRELDAVLMGAVFATAGEVITSAALVRAAAAEPPPGDSDGSGV